VALGNWGEFRMLFLPQNDKRYVKNVEKNILQISINQNIVQESAEFLTQ